MRASRPGRLRPALAIAACAARLLLTSPGLSQSESNDAKPPERPLTEPSPWSGRPSELNIDCPSLHKPAAVAACIKLRDGDKKPEQAEYDTPDRADVRLARRSLRTKTPVTFERGRIKVTGTVLSVQKDKNIWHIQMELAGN